MRHLALAGRGDTLSDFHLLAGIAAVHAVSPPGSTDWVRILDLYDALAERGSTPVASLNRLVAWSMVHAPGEALPTLDELERQPRTPPRHLIAAARADLLERCGRDREAAAEFLKAAESALNEPDRRSLMRRAELATARS